MSKGVGDHVNLQVLLAFGSVIPGAVAAFGCAVSVRVSMIAAVEACPRPSGPRSNPRKSCTICSNTPAFTQR